MVLPRSSDTRLQRRPERVRGCASRNSKAWRPSHPRAKQSTFDGSGLLASQPCEGGRIKCQRTRCAIVAVVSSAWSYRPALDGVRAVAVYAVVLFHSGVLVASGGFIGVDLFFVLSGFLVTNVILVEHDAGSFRPIQFWARRFRRLLPAAAVVIVVSAVLFVGLAPPAEREAAIADARSAALYVSNWHFLSLGSDYFASQDLPRPFAHFWSLSVEEQFYFVFPLTVAAAAWVARRRRRRLDGVLGLAIGALTVGSLASQIWSANFSEMRAYYATDARVYQILIGSLAALLFRAPLWRDRLSRASSGILGAVTALSLAAFVVLASSLLDLAVSQRGMLAATVSVLLVSSLELGPQSVAARTLSRPSLVHLGRLSYGTYLWHWPVIVMVGRLVEIGPMTTAITVVLVSTALAELTLRAVETPIRRSSKFDVRPRSTVAVGLAVSMLIGAVIVPAILKGDRPMVLATPTEAVVETSTDSIDFTLPPGIDWRAAKEDVSALPDCTSTVPEDCVVVAGSSDALHVHLIGDSHAQTLIPAFEDLAVSQGWNFSVTAAGGCPWQRNLRYSFFAEWCNVYQPIWYDEIIPALDPDVVVLFSLAFDYPELRQEMSVVSNTSSSTEQFDIARSTSEATIDSFLADGRRVVLLEPIPISNLDAPTCLSGASSLRECTFTAAEGPLPTEIAFRYFDLIHPEMVSVDIDELACPQLPLCLPVVDGIVVRVDGHHLTGSYAQHIASSIGDAIAVTGILDGATGQ